MSANKLTITLPSEVTEELSLFAKELGEKKSRIVSEALNLYFDIKDSELAEIRLKNREESYTLEEIEQELNL